METGDSATDVTDRDGTFDNSEHSVRLVQGDGETQGLQILLLVEQIGQLLLPSHINKHTLKMSLDPFSLLMVNLNK